MLYILQAGKYDDFQKYVKSYKGKSNDSKPCTYCKEVLFKNVKSTKLKSQEFAATQFRDPAALIKAILEYNQKSKKDCLNLSHLLDEKACKALLRNS